MTENEVHLEQLNTGAPEILATFQAAEDGKLDGRPVVVEEEAAAEEEEEAGPQA